MEPSKLSEADQQTTLDVVDVLARKDRLIAEFHEATEASARQRIRDELSIVRRDLNAVVLAMYGGDKDVAYMSDDYAEEFRAMSMIIEVPKAPPPRRFPQVDRRRTRQGER